MKSSFLKISPSKESTFLFAVAKHKNLIENKIHNISCKNGCPISGYVYDSHHDEYSISCNDFVELGVIPCSLSATVDNCIDWNIHIPIPDKLIKKHMSTTQKKIFKKFAGKFDENYTIHFVQMIDPNII